MCLTPQIKGKESSRMSVWPTEERQLKTDGRRLSSLRWASPGEHAGGLAVTRGPLAGAGAEEPPGETGR